MICVISGPGLLRDDRRLPVCVCTLDEDPVDDDVGAEHAARHIRRELPGRFVGNGAGQLDEPTAKRADAEVELPGHRIVLERVEQIVLGPVRLFILRRLVLAGAESAHGALHTVLVDGTQQSPGYESEEQSGTEPEGPGECQAQRASRFVIALSQRPSHGSRVHARLNPL